MKEKQNPVSLAMRYHRIVVLVAVLLVGLGVLALIHINKNEFPDYTIRQGIVVAAYPGATSEQIEQEVTKPLEDYIFTYKEVKKEKTTSLSRDGLCIIQVELNDDINDTEKDNFWSRFKLGVQQFKAQLPSGVLAVQVQDDFGDASALLITMESEEKTYRELHDYMKQLKERLRGIESVGRMTVYGERQEQIAIEVDTRKLSQYGIGTSVVTTALATNGFTTTAGTLSTPRYEAPVHVERSLNQVNDVEQLVVWSSPTGQVVRVADIATVKREYPDPTSYVTNNGKKCIVLSVEMKKGRNITDMGEAVHKELDEFQASLPSEVSMFTITDQSKVVSDSINNFLEELLIAVVAVIIVVLLLLPVRVALVASSTIPISIFITLCIFQLLGIELNIVTLAALIGSLGMIVDNSIVIIDNYMELIAEGRDRKEASIESAKHFFKGIFTATMAISITFFPLAFTLTGMNHDFFKFFAPSITTVLLVSLLVAVLLVPYMQYFFIRKPTKVRLRADGKPHFSLLGAMQKGYDKSLGACVKHPYLVIAVTLVTIVAGALLMTTLPQRLMPQADRNQFAVEIYLPTGSSLSSTAAIADSLERIIRQDERVVSVASFKGMSSPRFQTGYAPQFGGPEYAQFIVNTTSNEATVQVLKKYRMKYANAFPGAYVRFKQLIYSDEANSVEIRLTGDDWAQLRHTADSLTALLRANDSLALVRNNVNGQQPTVQVKLDELKANRLGINNSLAELMLASRYNKSGLPIATIWDGDFGTPVVLKSSKASQASTADIADEQLPVAGGVRTVPLRQVAQVTSGWHDCQIPHRNGRRTITIMADVANGVNVLQLTQGLISRITPESLPDGISMEWGGEYEKSTTTTPQIQSGLMISIVIIFLLVLVHYRRISTALLILVSLTLVLFGTAMGVLIPGGNFSLTCYLGIVSLMGILVRNEIIMFDYAEELRVTEHLSVRDSIIVSAKRRMRPIFLTSAAASMGVVPMMTGGSSLWTPMGNVIFWGTLITMVMVLLVLPVAYSLIMSRAIKNEDTAEQ